VYTRRTRARARARAREKQEGEREKRKGARGDAGRENPLAQITRLGLLFIVGNFCFHREGASDRRSKDDLCAERSRILARARARASESESESESERERAYERASTVQGSRFKFLPASRGSNATAPRDDANHARQSLVRVIISRREIITRTREKKKTRKRNIVRSIDRFGRT